MKKYYHLFILFCPLLSAHAQTLDTAIVMSGLHYPVAFEIAPDGRFFCTEKGDGSNSPSQQAQIRVFDAGGAPLGVFYNLSDSTNSTSERGVLGICLDPGFTNNKYIYVYYVHLLNGDERIRIVRFTENNNTGTNPLIIFDQDVDDNLPGNHFAGNLHMHASEPAILYFTIGELGSSSNSQQLTNPYGKFLRIYTNGSIPADNPFYDDDNPSTGNDDRIWTYGHRNPFDFCFSTVNDSLYGSENGATTWDEANMIHKGKNYGWPSCEGDYLLGSSSNLCNNPAYEDPITEWGPGGVPAVTGILHYNSSVISQLDKHLLVACNNTGQIFDCTLGNAPFYNTVTSNVELMDMAVSLTTLKQGSDGCIYAMNGGYTNNGAIYRICPPGVSIEEQKENGWKVSIGPNPTTDLAVIRLDAPTGKEIKIEFYTINGKIAACLPSAALKKGTNEILISTKELKLGPGMYICRISSGTSHSVHLKLLVSE
jgi:glucose/arabinose dehydrogenase